MKENDKEAASISGGVQSLSKALNILDVLYAEGELGVTEIGKRLGLDKSSVHRLLATLKKHRYVQQSPVSKKYSNSYKLFELGTGVIERQGFKRQVYPYMQALSDKLGEAVSLGILDNGAAMYVAKIETSDTLKVCMPAGQHLPLHCTSAGKVLLAFQPPEIRQELLEGITFHRYTKNTIISRQFFIEQLDEITRQGYAMECEEHLPSIACVAAPLWGFRRRLVATLAVSLPSFRYKHAGLRGGIIANLLKTAREVSSSLGDQI